MKKILSFILVLCMALTFVACKSDDQTPDGMKNVAGENDAYFLYVPQSWITNNNGVTGAYYSAVDRANVSITAYSGDEYASSDEYWEDFKKNVDSISTEFEVVKEKEAKTVSGRNAVQYVYKMTVSGEKYQIQQIFMNYSNIMYVITYTAAEDRFEAHAEEVKQIRDQFRFK